MLFSTSHFEQHFEEQTLQKGLGIFRRGKVDLLQHPSRSEYRFFCGNKELFLRKNGPRLMEYSCACGKINNCEHLAAALFYFDPTLADKIDQKRLRSQSDPLRKKFLSIIKTVRDEALKELKKNEPLEFVHQFETKTRKGHDSLAFALAIMSEKWLFESLRESPGKQATEKLFTSLEKKLHASWKKGLSIQEKKCWLMATENAIRKNQSFGGDAFYFLGMRAVFLMRDKKHLLEFQNLLHQRKYVKKFGQAFDYLAILKFAADLREDPKSLSAENNNPQLLIARAELSVLKEKQDKALKLLHEKGKEVREFHPEYYADYLAYLEKIALKEHYAPAILFVMREKFLHQPFINERDLDNYIRLSANQWQYQLDLLITDLQEAKRYFSFQKLSLVLLKAKRYNEVIAEIRKEPNQFKLLHKVLLAQLPSYDVKQFPLYIKQLSKAVEEARYHQLQIGIFNEAKTYIDKLPAEVGSALLNKLTDQLGHQSFFAKYLNAEHQESMK